jgi:hypothetical protein
VSYLKACLGSNILCYTATSPAPSPAPYQAKYSTRSVGVDDEGTHVVSGGFVMLGVGSVAERELQRRGKTVSNVEAGECAGIVLQPYWGWKVSFSTKATAGRTHLL